MTAAQPGPQHDDDSDRDQEERQRPHGALPVGADRDRAQELLVLRREIGRKRATALRTGEEDTGIGTTTQDLLQCVARRFGRRERRLDCLQQLLHELVDVTVTGHCATTITQRLGTARSLPAILRVHARLDSARIDAAVYARPVDTARGSLAPAER